jgi:RNA polymerase sigma factor (sigma-70 family)
VGALVETLCHRHTNRPIARTARASRSTGRGMVGLLGTKRPASSASGAHAAERLFAEFAQTKDEGIREQLIRGHAQLAEKVARNFLTSGEPFEDVTQEAYIGLVKAVDTFDPTLGIKFSTYATHKINGQIRHYLRDRTSLIRQPGWLYERSRKVARLTEKLRQQLNREPTAEELASEAGIDPDEVREVLRTRGIFRVSSLDGPESHDSAEEIPLDRRRIQSLRAEASPLPLEEKLALREALNKLKRIERWVVYALYYRGLSQTEVATHLNISCNYVSHILRGALSRLRQILASQEVKESHLRAKTAAPAQMVGVAEGTATIDALTKLYTPRILRERLEEELLRASRCGYEITVVAIDIDRLGDFNQVHGFAQGDLLLTEVGKVLREKLRKVDLGSRYEGGTFIVMLPHTGERGKLGAVNRLLRAISEIELRTRSGKAQVTASGGVAAYPLDGDSKEELIEAALQGLELAKEGGGNRIASARDKR